MSSKFILDKELPFSRSFTSVSAYQMHYIDECSDSADGSEPVVLLLHGNPTWCFYYRHLIKELQGEFRLIAPDYIGCGLSDHPADVHYRASHRVDQVEELLDQLGIGKFSLVMHDWGGPIGTSLALRRPECIEKMVYLNTTITETETLPAVIKTAARPIIGKYLTKTSRRFLKLMLKFGAATKLPKSVKRGYFYPYRTRARRTAIWDFVADIPFDSSHPTYMEMLSIGQRLGELSEIPVQIVWGLKDPCFHREMLSKVVKCFPQADVFEIPEASHLVLEDAPEAANAVIKKFLVEEPAAETSAEHLPPKERVRGNALYEAFMESAQLYGKKDAVVVPTFLGSAVRYAHMNYESLAALCNQYQRGLTELGLSAGDKVLMLVSPGIDFLALSYAVIGRGAVPVFIDPGMGKENIFSCISDVKPDGFIGVPKAQLLRLLKRKLFSNLKYSVIASDFVKGGPNTSFLKKFSAKPLPEVASTGTTLIAFTSGATGSPKGVLFTDAMISEQLRIFSEVFGFEGGKKDLPLLPIFSLFSVPLGVCSVFPPLDPSKPLAVEPWKVLKVVGDVGADYSFGSPTLWNKIAEYCVRSQTKIPHIRKIFIAGAPVSLETLDRLQKVLEEGDVYTPYGATEALPVTLVSATEVLAHDNVAAESGELGTFLGKSVDGVEVKVIEPRGAAIASLADAKELPPRRIGEVIVKGANVSLEYFNRTESTKRSKITGDSEFWHRMGDMGYLDESGNLYFCGRQSHLVKVKERTYYSVPLERVFNAHTKVRRSALVSIHGGGSVGFAVEPYPQFWPETEQAAADFIEELKSLASEHELTRGIEKFYFHPSFPVDGRHNAKIFRDQLSIWASKLESVQRAA